MTKEALKERVKENIVDDINGKIRVYNKLVIDRKEKVEEMRQYRYDDNWTKDDEVLFTMYENDLDTWTECAGIMTKLLAFIESL